MHSVRKVKLKPQKAQEALTKTAAKMAASASPYTARSHSQLQLRSPSSLSKGELLSDLGVTPTDIQNAINSSDLLNQFERILHRALQNTSDNITDKLTREIREVGRRTTILEQRMDEVDVITSNQTEELESLKDEYSLLRTGPGGPTYG